MGVIQYICIMGIIKNLINISKAALGMDRLFVYLDPADNSVTLSKALVKHVKDNAADDKDTSVFVFRIKGTNLYGFTLQHGIKQPTQLCNIQYNDKYKCIGFESLNPSVGRILYDYGFKHDCKHRLSVSIQNTNGITFYQINHD